ncbi:MAG: hypothetical protein CMJ86_05755 [Planctomycetes bacterium]|nr:hypothetical protein [Planctomycetota bacterium]
MMEKYIFHLGYPKTGTTYLQRNIFTQLATKFSLITPEFENVGVNIKKFRRAIQSGVIPRSTRRKLAGRPLFLSLEGLLFDSMRLWRNGSFAPMNLHSALSGLRGLVPEASAEDIAVVLYLRRQDELLHSLFAESLTFHFAPVKTLNSLDKYAQAVMEGNSQPELPGYYYTFGNTLEAVRDAFGASQVHVRYYEDLRTCPEDEVAFWSKTCGQPLRWTPGSDNTRRVDASTKKADAESLRFTLLRMKERLAPNIKLPNRLSRAFKRGLSRFEFNSPPDVVMTPELRGLLEAHFAEVNRSDSLLMEVLPPRLQVHYCGRKVPRP